MPRTHNVTVSCPVPTGFKVDQVRGMFDLKAEKVASETFNVEIPADDELIDPGDGTPAPWRIGVIVGPSGSGKTTVAREAYGKRFRENGFRWDKSKAVIEQFGDHSMKTITQTLNAVGFSSPPSWVKPHHVLSGGERFRCDLARALLSAEKLVAFDEFTSVVDRTVAKIGSAAVARELRKNRFGEQKQFVAVGCHYDVLDWLEPDWVLDMASGQLARGRLHQRPRIELAIAPVHRSAWSLFRRHHYLNTGISSAARCFVAFWNDEPVAFTAWMHRMTRGREGKDMRGHRTVVLPDFQGVGIGNRLSEYCASIWSGVGGRAFSTTSHPGMIRYRHNSPLWKTIRCGMCSPTGQTGMMTNRAADGGNVSSCGRITAGFQYVGPALDSKIAEALANEYPTEHIFRALEKLGATSAKRIAAAAECSPGAALSSLKTLAEAGRVERFRVAANRWGFAVAKNEK